MMVSDHIDSNLPRSSSCIAGVQIAQSRRRMQLQRETWKRTKEGMKWVQKSLTRSFVGIVFRNMESIS